VNDHKKNLPNGGFQNVDKLDEDRVCLHFLLEQIWTLIGTYCTRFFPRTVRPRRSPPVGSPLDSLFLQESRTPAPINYVK
jgi:hypothetical protein